jgi:hypothetical protein
MTRVKLTFAVCGLSIAFCSIASADSDKRAPQIDLPSTIEKILPDDSIVVRQATTKVACAGFIQGLVDWAGERRTGANAHRIGAKMSSTKITETNETTYPWGHGGYSEGAFGWGGSKLTGRFNVLFSDRRIGAGGNRYDHSKSDIQDVTLHTDGRVEILLRSWGNTLLNLEEVTCYRDGFLTGLKREANGVSLVSFALRKETATPDSHPGTVWP